jgi:hypothetical protein
MRTLRKITMLFLAATLVALAGCSCCTQKSAAPWAAERAAGQAVASAENARLNPMAYPWVYMAPDAPRMASR